MGMFNRKEVAEKLKKKECIKPKTVCGESRTKQEFAQESDINYIMKRYLNSGQLPVHLQQLTPVFADVSGIGSFDDCLKRIERAKDAFMQLDPAIRFRFNNDPARLIAFLQDKNNYDEAVKLGLIDKPEEKKADEKK